MYSRVYVEITNICNMRCSFCHGHSRKAKNMSREEFSRVLDQLEGQTEYLYYHLMGEPLTHPDLPVFLEMANRRGLRSMLTTNGTLLDRRGLALLSAGVHKVSISLHSFEDGGEEQFLRYLEGTAAFAEAAVNAGTIVCFRLWNRGFDAGRNSMILDFLRTRLPGDWTPNTRGFRVRDKVFLEWGDRFQWPDSQAPLCGQQIRCHGMRDQFGILCDGSVVPCCLDSEGAVTLGNVFREELRDILASPRAQAIAEGFRRGIATEELCRRCGYAQRFR